MYSDNETVEDLLGFEDQVEQLHAIVTDPTMLPVTVGVLGDWGSGKSSLLRMAASRLRESGALVVEFSPWRIESYDDAKTAILSAVLDQVAARMATVEGVDPTRMERARSALVALRKRVRWMRVAGLAAKHLVTLSAPSLDELDGLLRDDPGEESPPSTESVSRDFRREFEEFVADAQVPVVVVLVDDLDRCLPEQVLDVLQAIRLFLAVPGTAFVLATDERVVRDAVRLRYPQASSASESDLPGEYLEKIVQVPLRVPPVGAAEAESYLNLLVAQAHLSPPQTALCMTKAREIRRRGSVSVAMNLGIAREAVGSLPDEAEREFALMSRIARLLAAGLKGNPRQIKRYLNALEMRWSTAKRRGLTGDLDRAVLARLMLLEYAEPRRLQELNRWQIQEAGKPAALAALEVHVRPSSHESQGKSRAGGSRKVERIESGSEARGTRDRSTFGPAADAAAWVDSPWLTGWLQLDPPLSGVDLAPYFELGRAALPALAVRARELPDRLQLLLQRMASATSDVRDTAAGEAAGLPDSDAIALLEAGADRLASEASPGDLAVALAAAVGAHPAALPAVLGAVRGLPYEGLKPSLPFALSERLATTPALADLIVLLEQWAAQTVNSRLAQAASQARQKLG